MDWIERWFNVSPDNGDGTLELLVFVVLFLAAIALVASTRPAARTAIRKGYAAILRWRVRKGA
jgi:hypothetical protein